MAENTKRSLFGFHGLFGFVISVVGLLAICVALMLLVTITQRNAVEEPYNPSVIRDVNNVKMISVDNKNFAFQKKDK